MAKCPHTNVQQFTEMCLDCGRNIYQSDEDYLKALRERVKQKRAREHAVDVQREIEALEAESAEDKPADKSENVCGACGHDHYGMC